MAMYPFSGARTEKKLSGEEIMERKKKEYFKGLKTVWGQQGIQRQIFLSMFLIVLLGVGTLINFM